MTKSSAWETTYARNTSPPPLGRQCFRKRFMQILASKGSHDGALAVPGALLLPPLMPRFPFSSRSSTGAFSHSLMSHSTCRSTIRSTTNLRTSECGIVSKYSDRSASTTSVCPAEKPVRFPDGIDRATTWPITIGTVLQARLVYQLQHDLGGGLNHPIPNYPDAERAFASRLENPHTPHRLRSIPLRNKCPAQGPANQTSTPDTSSNRKLFHRHSALPLCAGRGIRISKNILTTARGDCLPFRAAFPQYTVGRAFDLSRPARGLIAVMARWIAQPPNSGFCHSAPVQPVAQLNCSSATGPIDNYPDGICLHC